MIVISSMVIADCDSNNIDIDRDENFFSFCELRWGKTTVSYTKPQRRKTEGREWLRGEREIRSSLLILDLKDGKL